MKQIIINGGNILTGNIKIGGAKNSAVALMPAALLADGVSKISNVPNITDKDALFDIISSLNCKVSMDGDVVIVDSSNMQNNVISEDLSNKLRASYYFMGVLLSKYNFVQMYFPGGCNIGKRPIDLHLKGFEKLGAKVEHEEATHMYTISADKLKGADITLDFPSVGATINLMFAAVKAEGTTTINNAAKEVEIINIADYLNKMGANITGAGTSKITIKGVDTLHSADISVVCDRIEAGTYLILGAMLGKDLNVCGINPEYIQSLLDKFKMMGIDYEVNSDSIKISKTDNFKAIDITTEVYPGFPTDLGQPMSVLLSQANGKSRFHETIWENRIGHVPHLVKMGAQIKIIDNMNLEISGPSPLTGEKLNATDLRGGAALVMAGLVAKNTTVISNIEYILRGYENLIKKLQNVGADIKIIDNE